MFFSRQSIIPILFLSLIIFKYKLNYKIDDSYFYLIIGIFMFSSSLNITEGFDGSSIAFDKSSFENLNRVVNEIASSGNLTVPANLIVKGNISVDGSSTLKGTSTIKGDSYFNKNVIIDKSILVKENATVNKTLDSKGNFNNYGVFRDNSGNAAFKNTKTNKWTHITHPDGRLILDASKIEINARSNGINFITGSAIFNKAATFHHDVYIKNLIPQVIKSSSTNGSFTNGNVNPISIQSGLTVAKPIKVTSVGNQAPNELIRYDDWISIAEGDTRLTRDKQEGWTNAMFANGKTVDDKGYRRTMFKILKGEDRPGSNTPFKDYGHNPAKSTSNRGW